MQTRLVNCHKCEGRGYFHDDYQGSWMCTQCDGVGKAEVFDVDPAPFGKLNVPNPDFLHQEFAAFEASKKQK